MIVLAVLAACSDPELAKKEEELQVLQRDLDSLREELRKVRSDFESVTGRGADRQADADAEPPRKGAQGPFGHQLPRRPLREELRWTVLRSGVPAELPPLPAPVATEAACGFSLDLPTLRALSDPVLRKSGLGRSSPLLLLENGEALAAHGGDDLGLACDGTFRHHGPQVQFAPRRERGAVASNTYRLAYAEELPLPRGDDGRPLYWVFPGTALEVRFQDPWESSWGEAELSLGFKVVGGLEGRPLWQAPGQLALITEPAGGVSVVLDDRLMDRTWSVRVSSPVDGPFVVLDTLTVGNSEWAAVVTGERAFERSR